MDNENHKSTWNNFTKFVLWGSIAVATIFNFDGHISLIMIIGSIKENLEKEQRIAITRVVYKSLGLALVLPENYGFHWE